MNINCKILALLTLFFFESTLFSQVTNYPIVDTGVKDFYNNNSIISETLPGDTFYGQDANYTHNDPSYTDNGDGTITDNVTGLTWEKEMGLKITYAEAFVKADSMTLGGYDDWRVPTIKELYSLILFTGRLKGGTIYEKFIDTLHFEQPYGDESIGERIIDAQTWSSTQYLSTTMNGDSTVFGVNFLDGRIKGYPKYKPGSNNNIPRTMYFRMVRGNTAYGKNNFIDNGDGTITDNATGLMWQKSDDGQPRDWQGALEYAENLEEADYDDWRLPNAKELQGIVDYSRCPDVTSSAAIDPLFDCTEITDPAGNSGQYPYFWSSTTHLDGSNPYSGAVYLAFGEAQGKMNNNLLDVHGAGAQRSDPKTGDPADYPEYFGPQGDLRYVFNYVRCVRDAGVISSSMKSKHSGISEIEIVPNPVRDQVSIRLDRTYKNIQLSVFTRDAIEIMKRNVHNTDVVELLLKEELAGTYYIFLVADGKGMSDSFVISR